MCQSINRSITINLQRVISLLFRQIKRVKGCHVVKDLNQELFEKLEHAKK